MIYRCACGCGQIAGDLHHCLIHRMKNYPELNDERNLVPVNHAEHTSRKFDNLKYRKFFWDYQVKKYGLEKMNEWVDSLPAKLKYRIDWR